MKFDNPFLSDEELSDDEQPQNIEETIVISKESRNHRNSEHAHPLLPAVVRKTPQIRRTNALTPVSCCRCSAHTPQTRCAARLSSARFCVGSWSAGAIALDALAPSSPVPQETNVCGTVRPIFIHTILKLTLARVFERDAPQSSPTKNTFKSSATGITNSSRRPSCSRTREICPTTTPSTPYSSST